MRDPRQGLISQVAKRHAQADIEAGRLGALGLERALAEVPDFDPESDDTIYYRDEYRLLAARFLDAGMVVR